jgi:DUF4097 and DUF4098 domain-containing protein YvlB
MRRALSLLLVLPLWAVASAGQNQSHSNTVTMNDDSASDDCAQHLRVYNDEYRASVRGEETRTVPNQPLTITAEHNGGIQVTTWDKAEISLKLCKQVAADDEATARKIVNESELQVSGGNVIVITPEYSQDHSIGTVLLVKAPKGANLDMSVHNGGISLNGFNGTAKAHAKNGGISFKRSTGTLVAEAQNGGVSIKDCSGDVNARVQNGGLSISLPEQWEGKGLEAHTQNGGLTVAVPKNLNTAVEIATSEHTSIICKDDVCNDAQRTWDNGHKMLRFGSGNPLIRATTVNGGVVVHARRAEL